MQKLGKQGSAMFINSLCRNQSQTSFRAGHTSLFSDYDKTFFQASQNAVKNIRNPENASQIEDAKYNFGIFNDFLSKIRPKFTFTLTSGRNLPEFQNNVFTFEQNGIAHPLPDRFVSRDGGDNFALVPEAAAIIDKFKKLNPNPDEYSNFVHKSRLYLPDTITYQKREAAKAFNWKYEALKHRIKRFCEHKTGNELVYAPTNNSSDYNFKITYRDAGRPKNYVVKEDDGKLFIGLKAQTPEIANALAQNLNKHRANNELGDFITEVDGRRLKIKPNVQPVYSKLSDPLAALKKAIESDDLIIVSGDSSNDVEMLNLKNYIKGNITREKIKNTPVVSIIVDNGSGGNGEALESLKRTLPSFNDDGMLRYIYVSRNGGDVATLTDAVKLAIKSYARENPKYAKALSEKISYEFARELGVNSTK
ncbi:MAG: hypothetical protein PHX18_07695 [Candidatus Gastranaerophilales bacterium]|nr:hypothetical protein [Candidatus Gastranaerophilales bacterium]